MQDTTSLEPKKIKYSDLCCKRCHNFMCTLPKGHAGPHGRQYRK